MGNPTFIAGLVEKRAAVERELAETQKPVLERRNDIRQIDEVLKVQAANVQAAKMVATRHSRSRFFVSGELSCRCLEALREASDGSVTAVDVAVRAARDKRLNEANADLKADFTRRIMTTKKALRLRGTVEKRGVGAVAQWHLAPRSRDVAE